MKTLILLLFFAVLSLTAQAQNSMYVENGYLVIHVKLDEKIDLKRLAEILNVKSSGEYSELDQILLTYEDYYRLTGQILPAWVHNFKENLRLIERLNSGTIKPESIGNMSLRYSLRTNQVTKIGDIDIDYDFRTNKITQVGDIKIQYNFFTGKAEQVGDLKIEYHPFNGSIRKLGEFDLK